VLICLIDASMCACECFCFCKLMINVEEVMYYAFSAYKCIIRIISVNMCHIIQNFYKNIVEEVRKLGKWEKREHARKDKPVS